MAQANRLKRSSYGISLTGKWIFRAILLALLVHVGLWYAFQNTILEKYGDPYYERLVPRSFKVNRVDIDPALLEPPKPTAKKPTAEPVNPIEIPSDPNEFQELLQDVKMAPAAPESTDPLPTEKPQVESKIDEAIKKTQSSASALALNEFKDIRSQLLDNAPVVPGRPLIDLSSHPGASADIAPGFTDLDELLAQSGPVPSSQPILMDAGLLFSYDSFAVSPAAEPDLRKLAALIQRSPNSRAIIEGHTDSTGTDEYNFALSQRRAMSVKLWLVRNAGIPAQRISTTGYGSSRLLVPADRSIEEQQLNRRVEVTIKSRRKAE